MFTQFDVELHQMFDAQLVVANEFLDVFEGSHQTVVFRDKLIADGLLNTLGFDVAVGHEI